MSHLSLILKVTRLCNLHCDYCFQRGNDPDLVMPFDILARTIASALSCPKIKTVNFIWHGGEPTTLPISFFKKAMYIQSRFRRKYQEINNSMQTNGTRLTEEWALFFRKFNFTLGVSVDGPEIIHNIHRVYKNGKPSWNNTINGIRVLHNNRVPYSTLSVISSSTLQIGAGKLFDFFLENKIKHVGLLNVRPDVFDNDGLKSMEFVTQEQMSEFLIELYEIWEENRASGVKIREIEDIRRQVNPDFYGNNIGSYCSYSGDCFGKFFHIDPNGDIGHCDRFVDDPGYMLGNIKDTTFNLIRNSRKIYALKQQDKQATSLFKECEEVHICRTGCPHDRYIEARYRKNNNSRCCGRKGLIKFVRQKMKSETLNQGETK